jgi:hypothetical protein
LKLARDESGVWTATATEEEQRQKGLYIPRLEESLTAFDRLFHAAQERDHFQFILSLLAFRGIQGPGWDAFENTVLGTGKGSDAERSDAPDAPLNDGRPASAGLPEDGRGGFRTCDLSRVKRALSH